MYNYKRRTKGKMMPNNMMDSISSFKKNHKYKLPISDEDLLRISRIYRTPMYIYDENSIYRVLNYFMKAFEVYGNHTLWYSAKANSALGILSLLRRAGCRLDACSFGEVILARRAGFKDSDISVTSCYLSDQELHEIGNSEINLNVDSIQQMEKFAETKPRNRAIGLRVNPGIIGGARNLLGPAIAGSKFGIPLKDVPEAYDRAKDLGLEIRGLHFHIGSGNLMPDPYIKALDRVAQVAESLPPLDFLSIGGGFGLAYAPWLSDLDIRILAERIDYIMKRFPHNKNARIELRTEPGEYIVGNAGILLCSIVAVKEFEVQLSQTNHREVRNIAIVDGSLNLLVGAAQQGTYYPMRAITKKKVECTKNYDIAGCLNQSMDWLAVNREFPILQEGDLIAIGMAGAYASVRQSRFNGRTAPREILIKKGQPITIREPEGVETLAFGHLIIS